MPQIEYIPHPWLAVYTLTATIMESSILNCIRVDLISICWCWIRLQTKVVLISKNPLSNQLKWNTGQPRQYRTEWNGSNTICCHLRWLTDQYDVCFLLNRFAFSLGGIMPRSLQEQILVLIVRLSAKDYSQGQEYLLCQKDASAKFCDETETLVGHISGGVEVGGVWPQPEKTDS